MASRLYVPVASRVFTHHREKYIKQFRLLGNPYIAVYIDRTFIPEANRNNLKDLRENLAFLRSSGFDALVWIQAFGFGTPLEGKEAEAAASFTRITELSGGVCGDAMCPTDPAFMEFYLELVRGVARAGAQRIMLDDDLCLSVRPGLGCACERHLKLFEERIGRPVSRDELKGSLFCGAGSDLRREWLDLMGDTLKEFCRAVRTAADEINPEIEMGFCAGYTSWDLEGVDALTLTKILAGKHKPFLRLTGAPYWTESRRFPGQQMPQIVEFTRMQRMWCEGSGVEIFTENDSYPRPRYRVPAAVLETFDFCMSADSPIGQLKYLFDYYSRPGYEDGYLNAHLRNEPVIRRVRETVGPMPASGVWIYENMQKARGMNVPHAPSPAFETMQTAFSAAASLLSSCAVPTVYEPHDGVAAVFGDGGRTVPLTPRKGFILDYPAALELMRRGVDTGLIPAEEETAPVPFTERFLREDDSVLLDGCVRPSAVQVGPVFHRCRIAPAAQPESVFPSPDGDIPASYRYENAQGQKFLVFLFDGIAVKSNSALSCSYYRQMQIIEACRWMGAPLPAMCKGHPSLYLICKEEADALAVAFCNFSLDPMDSPVIDLSSAWEHAEFIGCSGRLEENRILLCGTGAWQFGAVRLTGRTARQ